MDRHDSRSWLADRLRRRGRHRILNLLRQSGATGTEEKEGTLLQVFQKEKRIRQHYLQLQRVCRVFSSLFSIELFLVTKTFLFSPYCSVISVAGTAPINRGNHPAPRVRPKLQGGAPGAQRGTLPQAGDLAS